MSLVGKHAENSPDLVVGRCAAREVFGKHFGSLGIVPDVNRDTCAVFVAVLDLVKASGNDDVFKTFDHGRTGHRQEILHNGKRSKSARGILQLCNARNAGLGRLRHSVVLIVAMDR